MFDWDEDVEALYVRTVFEESPMKPVRPRRLRSKVGRTFVALLVLFSISFVARAVLRPVDGAWSLNARHAVILGQLDELPVGLLAYGHTEFTNFRHGILQFSDAELLRLAQTTAGQLQAADDLMWPYWHDALQLTNLELSRRGLPSVDSPLDL
jgi:hypothetical protein